MTLKVSIDPSTSSNTKSPCPVSLMTPHGMGHTVAHMAAYYGGNASTLKDESNDLFRTS